jgi:prepilin peptidase CpaA
MYLAAATGVAALAAWTDLRSGRIPNWLTLGALLAGVVARAVSGWMFFGGLRGALLSGGYSIAGALVCGLVPFLLYWLGGAGGGDVKLFAAIGALCHPAMGLEIETYSFVAAALIAPAVLAYKGKLLATLGRSLALATNPLRPQERRREIPHELMTWFRMGPAVFLGAAMTTLLQWPGSR